MTKHNEWNEYEQRIDLLVGGTPCQSFSLAGLRKGLADPRGNLMLTFGAIAAQYRPTWLCWENVPGVLSSNVGKDFASFLGLLTGTVVEPPSIEGWKNSGVLAGHKSAYGVAWRVLDAQYFGVAQRRRRVFVVAHIGGLWQRSAAVLFERASLCGNPPPSREQGEGAARGFTAGSFGGFAEGCGTLRKSGGDIGGGSETLAVTHSLRASHEASEDGTGRGTPLVSVKPSAFPLQSGFGVGEPEENLSPTLVKNQVMAVHCADVAPTLGKESMSPMKSSSGQMMDFAIVQPRPITLASGQGNGEIGHDSAPCLTCNHEAPIVFDPHRGVPATVGALTAQGDGGRAGQDANSGQAIPVEIRKESFGVPVDTTGFQGDRVVGEGDVFPCLSSQGGNNGGGPGALALTSVKQTPASDVSGALHTALATSNGDGNDERTVAVGMAVRRLTPLECERLQAFPQDHTKIPWRLYQAETFIGDEKLSDRFTPEEITKATNECPDGPRYKALGNSMCVAVMHWIGKRIQEVHDLPYPEQK